MRLITHPAAIKLMPMMKAAAAKIKVGNLGTSPVSRYSTSMGMVAMAAKANQGMANIQKADSGLKSRKSLKSLIEIFHPSE
jgi:hypothetical protein